MLKVLHSVTNVIVALLNQTPTQLIVSHVHVATRKVARVRQIANYVLPAHIRTAHRSVHVTCVNPATSPQRSELLVVKNVPSVKLSLNMAQPAATTAQKVVTVVSFILLLVLPVQLAIMVSTYQQPAVICVQLVRHNRTQVKQVVWLANLVISLLCLVKKVVLHVHQAHIA
jgi:uncharacterized protein YhhL (DUF1145 family)